MVSGCPSKDSEPAKYFPRGSSLKTVGYGSVEKEVIIKKYQPEIVIESQLGKDRLMSLYAINSPTQQNYQSHKFSSLEKLKTDELAYSNSNINSKDQSAKMNIQDQRGSEPAKPEVLLTEPEKQMPFQFLSLSQESKGPVPCSRDSVKKSRTSKVSQNKSYTSLASSPKSSVKKGSSPKSSLKKKSKSSEKLSSSKKGSVSKLKGKNITIEPPKLMISPPKSSMIGKIVKSNEILSQRRKSAGNA